MKKVLAFITALTALCCTACDNKKDNSSKNPPVGDVTSAVAEADVSENTGENTENAEVSDENSVNSQPAAELKHYTLNDFREIKVNLNKQEISPPIEFKEYDLSGIEFKAKKSPCTLPENLKIENICPTSIDSAKSYSMDHEEYCQKFIESYASILESENKPLILYTAFDGENLYYLGDYDIPCPRVSHNFEIFKYNPETGENTSIYEYYNGTDGITIADMIHYDDSLWLITVESYEIVTHRFDESSGKFNEDILESEIDILHLLSPETESTYDGYKSTCVLTYDSGSDVELVKENRKMTAYTDKIKLETGINKCIPILSTDKRMCFLQADSDVSILHTFDFEKMEKYTTRFESADANRAYQLGNNVLVHYVSSQRCMYFIPELGAGFVLQDVEQTPSAMGSYYYNNDTLVNTHNNQLALTNFDTGVCRMEFYFIYKTLSAFIPNENFTPINTNPLKNLYIFDTK